jgi:FKBP12-rapamycin complex-associated protein
MSVINNLTAALTHPTTPNDILLTIINLAEFFQREEHDTRFIEFAKLGNIALKCKAYAKALYYKECDFRNFSDLNTFEELISLYYELKLPESAIGILKQAKKNKDNSSTIHEDNWYIKLHQWKEGLKTVNSKLQDTPDDPELIKMKIQCLDGLGDWEELLAMTPLPVNDNETSLILTKASLNLSQWDDLKKYNSHLKDVNDDIKYQKDFYDAIISINDAKYKEALEYVGLAKEEVDKKIKSLNLEPKAQSG